jgi:sulfide:quinone oxidoreductase
MAIAGREVRQRRRAPGEDRAMEKIERMAEPHIVVLGGGFGGLESAFYLRKLLGRRAKLTLISDRDHFLFKPNTIYVPFGKEPERYVIPLSETLHHRHIGFVQDSVTGLDPGAQRVTLAGGPDVPYDALIVATGATMRPGEVPGLAEHGNTIWTPDEMMRLRGSLDRLLATVRAGVGEQKVLFVVPPNNKCAGPLYEMVLMLDTWLRRQGVRPHVRIEYATYERSFIQVFGPRLHQVVATEFRERSIEGHLHQLVTAVEEGRAHFQDGRSIPFDLLVSFPPYAAAVSYAALASDERGFVKTSPQTRQVPDHPEIYAVGDGGDFPVKQAFLALLQADAVAEHLAQRILGEEPTAAFDPVSMCIMEQFDKATFAQVPLRVTGDPAMPVTVREDRLEEYKVGTGHLWRVGKKLLGTVLPARFRAGRPFHAGPTWTAMEAGLKVMASALAD